MKKVKLNTLLDNAAFKISANSKVWYFVVQKNKGDIIYQAKISGLTFHSKKSKLKKVFAL